ncbi:unnamed protein product, partial [Chrysoparadoxa australica]
MRIAKITRTTAETDISVELNLDGTGVYDNQTGVGFFDHMLDQLSRHALIDMTVRATGDLHIDDHHTVEDVGIAIGQALTRAMGDKTGIVRYGSCLLPMDDALVRAALDLSARPFLIWNVDLPTQKIGTFDTELVREFFQALSTHGGITLHIDMLHGVNSHHIAEAAFKAVARALRDALET